MNQSNECNIASEFHNTLDKVEADWYNVPFTAEILLNAYPELNNLDEAEAFRIFCQERNINHTGGYLGINSVMWQEWEKHKAL